jgi:hypothetical protein
MFHIVYLNNFVTLKTNSRILGLLYMDHLYERTSSTSNQNSGGCWAFLWFALANKKLWKVYDLSRLQSNDKINFSQNDGIIPLSVHRSRGGAGILGEGG